MAGGRDKPKAVPRKEGSVQKAKDPAKEDPADVGEKDPNCQATKDTEGKTKILTQSKIFAAKTATPDPQKAGSQKGKENVCIPNKES